MGEFQIALGEELILYVRHSAFLSTVPDKAEGDKSKTPSKSRREMMGDDIDMPPCDALYLVNYLFEIGPIVSAGMGNAAISHSEILAYQSNTGIEMNSWEARTLRRLSVEYLNQSYKSAALDCPAPWSSEVFEQVAQTSKAESLRESMRALAQL